MAEKLKKQIQDIYPLTPLQEGILFNWLHGRYRDAYFIQTNYRIFGLLEPAYVEQAFNLLVREYDSLRTMFIWDDIDEPVQVVLQQRTIDFQFVDLGHLDTGEKEAFVQGFRSKDQERSFHLQKDVLIRVAVLKLDNHTFELILSRHHIIVDGWSAAILVNNFVAVYAALASGVKPSLQPGRPFKEYLLWLERKNTATALQYWQNYLSGYSGYDGLSGCSGAIFHSACACSTNSP